MFHKKDACSKFENRKESEFLPNVTESKKRTRLKKDLLYFYLNYLPSTLQRLGNILAE